MNTTKPRKDNPATDPERENGQGRHEGVAHRPEEFDTVNPARQVDEDRESDRKRDRP